MDKNKLMQVRIILTVFVLLLIGTLAYSPIVKKLPYVGDGTYGWETYSNSSIDYKYEFNYPKDWEVFNYGDIVRGTAIAHEKNIIPPIYPSNSSSIKVFDNFNKLPIEKWLNEPFHNSPETSRDVINEYVFNGNNFSGSTYAEKKIMINGVESIEEVLIFNGNPIKRNIIIPMNKAMFIFSNTPLKGDADYDTFNKIISTFRSIEK